MRRLRLAALMAVMLAVGGAAAWPQVRTELPRWMPPVVMVYPAGSTVIGADTGEPLTPLNIDMPNPVFCSRPVVIPDDVRIDRARLGKARRGVYVPPGLANLALNQPVTSSDAYPIIGDLWMVTDGDKEALDGRFVELAPGRQWVQIDLGEVREVWAIAVWHMHLDPRYYRDVVVQVSDDPTFTGRVTTVFNNDHDNSSKLGVGADFEYDERFEGELIDAGGVRGRYVRLWSNGSTADSANHYGEVEVWGREPRRGPIVRWMGVVGRWAKRWGWR